MKIPDAKTAGGERMEKSEKYRHDSWLRNKNEVIAEARNEGKTVHFCVVNGSLSSQEFGVGATVSKIQRSSRTPRWHCERWFRIVMQSLLSRDHQHHKWRLQKWWILYQDYQGCAESAADAVSAYTQVKMQDAHKLLKIPKSECPDIWIRLPRHKWPKSWSSMEDPVVPLERNLYGHPSAGLLWERRIRKSFLERGLEKVDPQQLERLILICVCGWHQIWLDKKQNMDPMWKILMKDVDLEENQHLSLIMSIWIALKENVRQAKIL